VRIAHDAGSPPETGDKIDVLKQFNIVKFE
jgi:hypothetical protein